MRRYKRQGEFRKTDAWIGRRVNSNENYRFFLFLRKGRKVFIAKMIAGKVKVEEYSDIVCPGNLNIFSKGNSHS